MDVKKLQEMMDKRGVNQSDLAKILGKSRSAITALMQGKRRLNTDELLQIADRLKCSVSNLLGEDKKREVPVLGHVPGGNSNLQFELPANDYIHFPSKRDNIFALIVKGQSMNKIAPSESVIIVDKNEICPERLDGKLVVARIDGEVTFKRFQLNPCALKPDSTDPDYREIPVNESMNFEIIGRVIGSIQSYTNDDFRIG